MLQTQEKPRDLWTDDEFILAHGQEARARTPPVPVYLGRLRRAGWTGRIRTYLVWCESCGRCCADGGFTVAHEAGYDRRVVCAFCRTRFDHLLPSRRAKDALLNPHLHPWFLAFLFLAGLLIFLALR